MRGLGRLTGARGAVTHSLHLAAEPVQNGQIGEDEGTKGQDSTDLGQLQCGREMPLRFIEFAPPQVKESKLESAIHPAVQVAPFLSQGELLARAGEHLVRHHIAMLSQVHQAGDFQESHAAGGSGASAHDRLYLLHQRIHLGPLGQPVVRPDALGLHLEPFIPPGRVLSL